MSIKFFTALFRKLSRYIVFFFFFYDKLAPIII